ncbi:hypothetical protein [Alteribacillus sp. HJP-4]|uniref:hypothetical protein n=1 Tax=Alteribacillus sp. HJP-4 TaxID=2775394 RepID=UPI0035CD1E61
MNKKFLFSALAGVLAVGMLTACGGAGDEPVEDPGEEDMEMEEEQDMQEEKDFDQEMEEDPAEEE